MDADTCSWPERLQLGGRLIHPLHYLETEKLFLVKSLLVFEHEIGRSPEFVGKNREGLGFAVFTGEPFEIFFRRFVTLEEKDRCLGEGPLKMSVTDLFTTGSVFFAVGFFDALDQTAVGDEILDRGEALDGFNLVEDDQTEDSADPGDGLKQGIGSQVVFFGTGNDITFELGQEVVIGFNDFQVNGHAFLDGRVIEAIDDPFTVLGFGNAPQGIGKVILASSVLDMGKEFGAFSHEVISPSEEISGCPHPCGVDIGLRKHTSPE